MDYEESGFAWVERPESEARIDPSTLTRLRFALEGGVATLTLDRPEQRNAIDSRLLLELTRALHHCDRSDEVRVVVLTGAGAVFCAGSELSDRGFGGEPAGGEGDLAREDRNWLAPFQVRKPVLAALNGHTVGAGLTLALQCDIRVVAAEAILSFPFVRLGVIGEWMGHWTAVQHLGVARAADLLLTGRRFSGTDAETWGLASRCVPAAEVLPTTVELAHELAERAAPVPLAVSKRLVWEAATSDRFSAGRSERLLLENLVETHDAREGVAAYLAKRSPQWSGRPSCDLPAWPADLNP